ncbi:MAG: hypothetical protein KGO82_18585 [Bacteroidota bacterium]|nr:hypothetical protein [Bacteroidota bacterium]
MSTPDPLESESIFGEGYDKGNDGKKTYQILLVFLIVYVLTLAETLWTSVFKELGTGNINTGPAILLALLLAIPVISTVLLLLRSKIGWIIASSYFILANLIFAQGIFVVIRRGLEGYGFGNFKDLFVIALSLISLIFLMLPGVRKHLAIARVTVFWVIGLTVLLTASLFAIRILQPW